MAKRQRQAIVKPTSDDIQGFVPRGMRPKGDANGASREKHVYGVVIAAGDDTIVLATGLQRSGAEAAAHVANMLLRYPDKFTGEPSVVDEGTVTTYKAERGLINGDND